ncbi:N-acetylglucosamine-6-phosphate deacetylase [Olivibacter sp. XZL3]|uniref:N-acetylglucosamine-6-phosphate deacetylase n=1 Tax=Olivibacter sp. XZL3 TaxID=1735116 RepID=UPI0010653AC3|nr:N-acetylglucosamine-6-phosphate deacetylase [Olivibacter sp. XZL3]
MKIFANRVFTGETVLEKQLIICNETKIIAIQAGEAAEADEIVENIAPGFFDIQVNGGAQYHFTAHPTEECLADIEEACLADGTAFVLPTLITSSLDNILIGIEAVKRYLAKYPQSGILGMHLEGPFLNPVKRGAHLSKYIQKPQEELVRKIITHGKGTILQMTIAPEAFDTPTLSVLIASGIPLAVGHTDATYEIAKSAFDMGIRQVTHLFNAMSPFLHRQPGVVGAVFDDERIYAPIVLDGKHVDFAAARAAYKVKRDKLFLISDALFLGKKKTDFQWEGFDARLCNGEYVNSEGNLAGANISLGDAVKNARKELDVSLQEAIEMATYRPAKAVGLSHRIGRIASGYPARFTVFDDELERLRVLSSN